MLSPGQASPGHDDELCKTLDHICRTPVPHSLFPKHPCPFEASFLFTFGHVWPADVLTSRECGLGMGWGSKQGCGSTAGLLTLAPLVSVNFIWASRVRTTYVPTYTCRHFAYNHALCQVLRQVPGLGFGFGLGLGLESIFGGLECGSRFRWSLASCRWQLSGDNRFWIESEQVILHADQVGIQKCNRAAIQEPGHCLLSPSPSLALSLSLYLWGGRFGFCVLAAALFERTNRGGAPYRLLLLRFVLAGYCGF